jgi:DNA-binding MarR family transcriptional regulator
MPDLNLSDFADRMNEIIPVMMKEFGRRQTDGLFKVKITLPQLLLLNFINIQGESSMTSIAKFMHVSTAAMTGIVERLVRDKYVVRVYDPDDRRVIRVKLTTKGSELLKKINQQRRQLIVKVFGKISPQERQEYLRIISRIHDILLKEKEA